MASHKYGTQKTQTGGQDDLSVGSLQRLDLAQFLLKKT